MLWFLYRSLKFIASPTYDSVVVGVSEGCVVVSVSFFEVCCQWHRISGHSLVHSAQPVLSGHLAIPQG